MTTSLIFNFKSDLSTIPIPSKLNNPFQLNIPEIGKIACDEFQNFLAQSTQNWTYDFTSRPGKMFGVLVVQKEDKNLAFLGAMSGNLPKNKTAKGLIPSIFDASTDNYFFDREMKEITVLTNKIRASNQSKIINELKKTRSKKSKEVQRKLFKHFNFLNILNEEKNILPIFNDAINKKPPAGAGECAAPKLLQYALKNNLKPIAIAEFWWGKPTKDNIKKHLHFYPACLSKCQPILEFMLDDYNLFNKSI